MIQQLWGMPCMGYRSKNDGDSCYCGLCRYDCKDLLGHTVQIIHAGCDLDRLSASQDALSQLLKPAIVKLQVVWQKFFCHQQQSLCVDVCQAMCTCRDSDHSSPALITGILTLLRHIPPKILACCRPCCLCPAALPAPPASLHLHNPLLPPYPALSLLQSWVGNH